VVLAVVLTVVSGLLARSLQHVVSIDHGFRPDGVVAVNLNLRPRPAVNASRASAGHTWIFRNG
jgi:hypothetical protein